MFDFKKSPNSAAPQPPTVEQSQALTVEQLGNGFRALCDEHIEQLSRDTTQDAQLWDQIAARCEQAESTGPGLRALDPLQPRKLRGRRIALFVAAAGVLGAGAWSLSGLQAEEHLVASPSLQKAKLQAANQENSLRLSYSVDGQPASMGAAADNSSLAARAPRRSTDWLASGESPLNVSFSDGSGLELRPHSKLFLDLRHVQDDENAHVEATLTQGSVDVHVQHHDGTDYRFLAGGYEVRVVGTSFELSYQASEDLLDLSMREGKVTVWTGSETRTVVAGQHLSLSHSRQLGSSAGDAFEREGAIDRGDPRSAAPQKAPAHAQRDRDKRTNSKASLSADKPLAGEAPHDFGVLAAQGEFERIVQIASEQGISRVLGGSGAGQLQELAQAARYTGRTALAERTWRTMRQRFPGQTAASNAGFFLGRLAAQSGANQSALQHFETYLRESPQGVYAAEAWGRKLQIYQATRSTSEARAVAKAYLRHYPSGPYKKTAQRLLRDN